MELYWLLNIIYFEFIRINLVWNSLPTPCIIQFKYLVSRNWMSSTVIWLLHSTPLNQSGTEGCLAQWKTFPSCLLRDSKDLSLTGPMLLTLRLPPHSGRAHRFLILKYSTTRFFGVNQKFYCRWSTDKSDSMHEIVPWQCGITLSFTGRDKWWKFVMQRERELERASRCVSQKAPHPHRVTVKRSALHREQSAIWDTHRQAFSCWLAMLRRRGDQEVGLQHFTNKYSKGRNIELRSVPTFVRW
jgi:hypothetical protein